MKKGFDITGNMRIYYGINSCKSQSILHSEDHLLAEVQDEHPQPDRAEFQSRSKRTFAVNRHGANKTKCG
jgi:hypothetical protein